MPAVIRDDTPTTPQTSYGSQKLGSELLVQDYSRKGFVDGRSLRLPTIVVRPGKPNAAASSFFSSIIREPLQGEEAICPVADTVEHLMMSPRRVVQCFLHAADLPPEAWGMNRSLVLPGRVVSVRGMLSDLRTVAGDGAVARVRFEDDPFIAKIVYGWPMRFDLHRAGDMGFRGDDSFREIIEAFIEDDLGGEFVA
jgi:nucleoside-diphosphate-sugar epimerase